MSFLGWKESRFSAEAIFDVTHVRFMSCSVDVSHRTRAALIFLVHVCSVSQRMILHYIYRSSEFAGRHA